MRISIVRMAIAPTGAIKREATINCCQLGRTATPMTIRGIGRRRQKLLQGEHGRIPAITATFGKRDEQDAAVC